MFTILLPTDFSENSWNAIDYAIQFFKDENCNFILLNTYTPATYNVNNVLGAPAEFGENDPIQKASNDNLDAFLKRISETYGENPKHSFKTMSKFDTLVAAINQFKEENKADLIIMGTKGASGAEEVLFGTNTVDVLKRVKSPIIAVPSGYQYEKPEKILFPTDFEVNYDEFQIDVLKFIAIANQATLDILHVSHDNVLSAKMQKRKEQLETKLEGVNFKYHQKASVNVTIAIEEFQTNENINLLAMVNNKHTFLERIFYSSNISLIGFHIKNPFLVMPAKELD